MKKIIYSILFMVLLGSCVPRQPREISVSKEDSLELERSLLALKNWSFNECYSLSMIETYKRLKVDINDSCRVNNLTGYYYINNTEIDLYWIFEDKNRQKLINKWVNKEGYTPFVNPPDFPDGSLDMVRALDFYNSEDLKIYIDSVRHAEYKKLLNGEKEY